MTWKELRFLVLMWIGLAVLAVAALEVAPVLAPVLGRFVAPLALLPTLFVYFCVFAPLYLVLRLLLWPFPPGRWRQWVADVVALSATVIIAFAIPFFFNPIVRAKASAIGAQEMPAPIKLSPAQAVALLQLDGNPVYGSSPSPNSLKVCNEFCTAILVSGYAKEVVVGFEYSRTGQITLGMMGLRYALNGKRPDCVYEEKDWQAWFAGKALSKARQIGGYSPAFVARYAGCISAAGLEPVANADIIFLEYHGDTRTDPAFWGVHWNPEFIDVIGAQSLFDNRNGKMIARIRRSNVIAATLDEPMYVKFSGGPVMTESTGWARTTIFRSDPGPFVDGWWGMIANGEDIYAEALARDRVAANPEPRALSRRRKMK